MTLDSRRWRSYEVRGIQGEAHGDGQLVRPGGCFSLRRRHRAAGGWLFSGFTSGSGSRGDKVGRNCTGSALRANKVGWLRSWLSGGVLLGMYCVQYGVVLVAQEVFCGISTGLVHVDGVGKDLVDVFS